MLRLSLSGRKIEEGELIVDSCWGGRTPSGTVSPFFLTERGSSVILVSIFEWYRRAPQNG